MSFLQPLFSDSVRRFSADPGDVNPYVTFLIHKYWDLLAEQYLLDLKMDETDYPQGWGRPNGKPLSHVSCTYIHDQNLTIYLVGADRYHSRGFAFFNGKLDRDVMNVWALKDLLYDLKRVYSLVRERATLCSTSVIAPNAHDLAEAIVAVDLIRKWRWG